MKKLAVFVCATFLWSICSIALAMVVAADSSPEPQRTAPAQVAETPTTGSVGLSLFGR